MQISIFHIRTCTFSPFFINDSQCACAQTGSEQYAGKNRQMIQQKTNKRTTKKKKTLHSVCLSYHLSKRRRKKTSNTLQTVMCCFNRSDGNTQMPQTKESEKNNNVQTDYMTFGAGIFTPFRSIQFQIVQAESYLLHFDLTCTTFAIFQ